jgi:hypothetical protein
MIQYAFYLFLGAKGVLVLSLLLIACGSWQIAALQHLCLSARLSISAFMHNIYSAASNAGGTCLLTPKLCQTFGITDFRGRDLLKA